MSVEFLDTNILYGPALVAPRNLHHRAVDHDCLGTTVLLPSC